MSAIARIGSALNVKKHCEKYEVGVWSCPQFLFIVMGVIIIGSIIVTDIVARRYAEPEIAALIVIVVATLLLIIGHAIISSFERIAESSRAKSEFISVVSHELRSPLSSIKWQIDMLMDMGLSISENDKKEALESMRVQNQKMLHIVNSMLEIHKVQEKVLDFRPEVFSLDELVKHVIDEYSPIAKHHNSTLSLVHDSDERVFADKKKIQVVIEHLIDNAIKYGSNGQEVVVKVENENGQAKVSVSDQGVGIPKEDAKKIFGKFFRAHNVLRYQIEGIGLGLYMARSIVEHSGGRIGFESKNGDGTTFWFALPVALNNKS